MKYCNKCKSGNPIDLFNVCNRNSDGLQCMCKVCEKEYRDRNNDKYKNYYKINKDKIRKNQKIYYQQNKSLIRKKEREKYKNNKKIILHRNNNGRYKNKQYLQNYYSNKNKSPVKHNSKSKYRQEIELYEEIKESTNGNLMCKCAYCGEGFEPTNLQIMGRINAINGKTRGEIRLYCSQSCKNNCPTYNQKLYPKDMKPATAREVQPQLRHMVFERDKYTCQKCNTHKNNLEVELHCHHIEGIQWEPLQSADTDMCITFCADYHKEVHRIPGCGYQDMQCKEPEMIYNHSIL